MNRNTDGIPLNKYLAHAGICSRRKAQDFIEAGQVNVNGLLVKMPGHRVQQHDLVTINNTVIKQQQKIYLLLNKPAGYITTCADQFDRKTVFDLVPKGQRLHAVGRLDRNTTGLLLITNDGALTQRLAHPKYQIRKIYEVVLNKPLRIIDKQQIKQGIMLDDGLAVVDYIASIGRNKIRMVLHSGKYRIIRRLFQKLGYGVVELDRVHYAGLTKRELKRGSWRYLTNEEVERLKVTINPC